MFVVVYRDTGNQLSGQIERDLAGDIGQLKQSLITLPSDTPLQVADSGGTVRARPAVQRDVEPPVRARARSWNGQ